MRAIYSALAHLHGTTRLPSPSLRSFRPSPFLVLPHSEQRYICSSISALVFGGFAKAVLLRNFLAKSLTKPTGFFQGFLVCGRISATNSARVTPVLSSRTWIQSRSETRAD